MAKHYPDRFDRGEDFSESPDIPDEFKVCACCERCDVDMVDMEPFMVLTSYGDTIESRYCYGRPSDAPTRCALWWNWRLRRLTLPPKPNTAATLTPPTA